MSTLSVACPYCQKQIKVPEKMLGREIRCPGCKQGLKLEGAGGPPPADGAGQGGVDFGNLAQTSGQTRRASAFWELLTFRRMIAPFVLQLLFWLAMLGNIASGGLLVVMGVLMLSGSAPAGGEANVSHDASVLAAYGSGGLIVGGLVTMILGPLITRMIFEMLIMVFRVYDVLREVRDKLDRR